MADLPNPAQAVDTSTAAITAMMDGVTEGPWAMNTLRTSCGVCHKVGPWPHKWRAGEEMSACIYDDYPSPPEGTDVMMANARFIASSRQLVPALQAERDDLRQAVQHANDHADMAKRERDAALARVAELEGLAQQVADADITLEGAACHSHLRTAIRHLRAALAKEEPTP